MRPDQSYQAQNRMTFNVGEGVDRRQAISDFTPNYPLVYSARDSGIGKTAIDRSGYLGSLVNEELELMLRKKNYELEALANEIEH